MTATFKFGLVSLLVLVQSWSQVSAEKMNDLYKATWPVADQSQENRQRALANGFAQVLVRASGSQQVLSEPSISASIANANQYMRQYSYQQLSIEEQAIYQTPFLLNASFDSQAVLRLLKDAQMPIWSEDRPLGVFWLGLEQQGQRQLIGDGQNEVSIALKRAAQLRGLPITIPLMDLEDESAVAIADVWGRLPQAVNQASTRYSAEYTVSGQLAFSNNQASWRGSWLVQFGNDHLRFSTEGQDINQVIEALVNRIADHLSSSLAVILSDQEQKLYLKIENMDSLQAYAKTRNYLQSLSMVKNASAIELAQDKVLFEVTIVSEVHYLLQALKLSKNLYPTQEEVLTEYPSVDPISGEQGILVNSPDLDTYHYRWVENQ